MKAKCKVAPLVTMKVYKGSRGMDPLILLPCDQREVSGQLQGTATLLPQKEVPSAHRIGGYVGPRASLDALTN
jgi:hypothetical protein